MEAQGPALRGSSGTSPARKSLGQPCTEVPGSALHGSQELTEQVGAVPGPGGTLGVILHTEGTICRALHAFDGLIQEVDMRHLQRRRRKAVLLNGIGVVLGSDLNLSGLQIFDRNLSL